MNAHMTIQEIDRLLRLRRRTQAEAAAAIYAETHSLRKTAARLHVSHETVRTLLREAHDMTDIEGNPLVG